MEGDTYQNFYLSNYTDEKLITNTLFDMIYGIYLMNDKLKLMHNDNHFGNVLIKIGLPSIETKYQIDNTEYLKEKNYRLCFFDFDLAFLENENNDYLNRNDNDHWIVQNKKSAKDIWTILNSFMRLNSVVNPAYLTNIINTILNNSERHKEMIKKIDRETRSRSKFWNAYCEDNIQSFCIIPDEPFLYPLSVLERYIGNERIKSMLDFIDQDVYYRKYIKYKNKYLALKKGK